RERDQAEDVVRPAVAEINQHDDRGDWQPVADDRECPRIAGVSFIDQAAYRAAFEVMRPTGEQRPFAAVRTASPDAAAQRGQNHCTFNSVTSNSSVAFGGIVDGSGVEDP